MNHEIPIPYAFLTLTQGYERRGELFKKYVIAYLKHSYPEMELLKIEGMKAICRRVDSGKPKAQSLG